MGSGTHYELLVVNIVCSSQVPTVLKSRIASFVNTSFTAGGKTSMPSIPVVCSQHVNYPGERQKTHQFCQSVNFGILSFCLSDEFWNLSLNPTVFFFFLKQWLSSLSITIAIFLGSFRLPYEEIRDIVLQVDEERLSESLIQVRLMCTVVW